MIPQCSKSLTNLPPYVFVHVEDMKKQAREKGLKLIDMAMGNPDMPTPSHIVEELARSAREDKWTHRYPLNRGIPELRKAIAQWYKKRFDVNLDPESEVLPLLGSKEGLAHLYYTFTSPKDYILATNPAYPVHYFTVTLSGAKLKMLPLKEKNNFLPDLAKVPQSVADKAKILILNYPNNPTGTTLDDTKLFEEAIAFAKNRQMIALHDFAYSEIVFDGYQAPSFMQVPDAKKYGVEYHSLSKSYNMAGWRVGFVVGNQDVIKHLAKYKSFLDYGIP
ncbi:MAG: aminotransferase class I/II-fold pyridoxal phosphate-dependent enzyme, partial [Elusimicrobia bacterium]|nr:aminotransferase class I/II-fold pyridoxal phosphate-dependent enzyme [Elusimicrobiota bacterium]